MGQTWGAGWGAQSHRDPQVVGQEWGPSGRLWGCPIARGTLELLCPTDLQLRPTASAPHRPIAVGQLCPIAMMLCPIAAMLCPIAAMLCPIAVVL